MTPGTKAAVAALSLAAAVAAPLLWPRWLEHRVRAAPRPLDVVLVTLDTTRADRLGCYGSAVAETPHLDGLARRGVTFRRAYAHVPLTCPSHSAMMTGLIPARHGVHDNGGFVLGETMPTLAEVFVEAGYRTGAFVSSYVLDRRFGLSRGFGRYEDDVLGGGRDRIEAEIQGDVTLGRALEWMGGPDSRPMFLWVHFYDPHEPYEPPEPYASRHKGRPYDGEVAFMDAQVGRLMEAVAKRGRPTLVAAIGDHGESLGDHEEVTHTYFIYSATQRVPFLLSLPGYLPEGNQVEAVVRGIDLMPTLLDVAGLPIPADIDGRSLVPLISGRSRREPGPAYLESYHPRLWWGARELLGLRTEDWLFIHSPQPELYRVSADPAETKNVASEHAAEMEALRARLLAMVGKGDPLAARAEIDPEAEARLRALGYAGSSPQLSVPVEQLPDAKENRKLLAGATRAAALIEKGKRAEALAVYQQTLTLNPRSHAIRGMIAGVYMKMKRYEEGFQALAELSLEDPRNESYPTRMAGARAAEGRWEEALAILRDAATRFPTSSRIHEEIGVALMNLKRLLEGEKELRLAVSLAPKQVAARLRHGIVLGRLKRLKDAAVELRHVVEASPKSDEAKDALRLLNALGSDLLGMGDHEEARRALRTVVDAGKGTEETYLNLGLITYRAGQRTETLQILRRATAELPDSAQLHYRLARLLDETGQRAEAEKEYRRALELQPGRADAREALGRMGGSR